MLIGDITRPNAPGIRARPVRPAGESKIKGYIEEWNEMCTIVMTRRT